MRLHTATLQHLRFISQWAWQRNASASIDAISFQLTVSCAGRAVRLFPRFVLRHQGQLAYTPALRADNVNGFIGWRPYETLQWPLAVDKLAFKAACRLAGLATPDHWTDTEAPDAGFLVKPARGSFGVGVRGPFMRGSPHTPSLRDGEFCEKYIDGPAIKVWYWGRVPICVEKLDPLQIRGNGHQTVLELTETTFRLASGERRDPFLARKTDLQALLRYQGVEWNTVLAPDQTLTVDFLYGSPLRDLGTENTNCLGQLDSRLNEQIVQAGGSLLNMTPPSAGRHVLHAVDGVIENGKRILWLEMNCNPMVPPDGYATMLDDLFGFAPS